MRLFLKCHKVSLEVILENEEKNSSGCFAWSWKVSVPKESVRENEGGEKREVERGKTAVQLPWSLQILPEPAPRAATKRKKESFAADC